MARLDHGRPRFKAQGRAVETVAGAAPATATTFASIASARARDARNKEHLSAIAAAFIARGEKAKK
ncbi:MAG: hypothetical protein KDJ20_07850 [Hyphomicrobiales bacterium]|nr:hypothetical protein [Amphiplicatus sp.]MCC2103944.1 hypothetical protein [Hyphomicrobiales bacterium]MCC2108182.1 hypothetical protein [Hyphomicrobiales bacterium]